MSDNDPEQNPELAIPSHPEVEPQIMMMPAIRDMTDEQLDELIERVRSDLEDMADMDIAMMLEGGPEGQAALDFMVEELRRAANKGIVDEIIYTKYNGNRLAFVQDILDDMLLDTSLRLTDLRVWKVILGVR